MAQNKTVANNMDVNAFIDAVEPVAKREDARLITQLMEEVTGEPATMWGSSIIGFGSHHYRYESGREGDLPLVGFSPRKQAITLYIMAGFEAYEGLLNKLGKHSTGKACLYIKKTADVDMAVLRELVRECADHMRRTNP